MTFEYRITKYHPLLRDENGAFLGDDWIGISAVGNLFDGQELSMAEYERVEQQYLSVVEAVFLYEKKPLHINGLEDRLGKCPFADGASLTEACDVLAVAKACLREEYWCRLVGDGVFFHFGYDYYMYGGCSMDEGQMRALTTKHGLFAEPMESPYHAEEDV